MSAVTTDALLSREAVDETLDPRRTESKFSLAMDAVTKEKSHAGSSVKAYLDVLLNVLSHLPVLPSRGSAFDTRIVANIEASKESVNQFRNFAVVIAESDKADDFTSHLSAFLEGVLAIKKNYSISVDAAYLWRDAPAFLCRELFVSTIAALLANGRWAAVVHLLNHRYQVSGNVGDFGFQAFDGFQRSLDVFRNRRLKLKRPSVSADILSERIKESALSFGQVMQADFVLHLHSLLGDGSASQVWYARTLGVAHEQRTTGFDLFIDIREGKSAGAPGALFGIGDWTQLHQRLEAVVANPLFDSEQSLDYLGFIAANNSMFIH